MGAALEICSFQNEQTLLPREWTSQKFEPGPKFTFLSWNILADKLSGSHPNRGGFTYLNDDVLDWGCRRSLIIQEIDRSGADIVCLCELDHFDWVSSQLSKRGFIGRFYAKEGSDDGSAVFWRSGLFSVVASQDLRYVDSSPKPDGSREFKFMSQGAIFVLLRPNTRAIPPLLVGMTHLKAKKFAGVRAVQAAQYYDLAETLTSGKMEFENVVDAAFLTELRSQEKIKIATILAGDFNADPEEPGIQQMKRGGSLSLQSAYAQVLSEDGQAEPAFTTWKQRDGGEETKHTIDYVFFNPLLTPVSVWDAPVTQYLTKPLSPRNGRRLDSAEDRKSLLPSLEYPSDHLALAVQFAAAESKSKP